jgi:DtxR family transcriptional regulator, Mn-dependent transcriptional regulator
MAFMGVEREEQLSASLEDYLEAIFNLADESEGARSKDIAERLGVARSSVTGAVQMLRDKGLANYRPYGSITLTGPGQSVAAEVARKHEVLTSFFADILGVDRDAAQQAACRAEHALGTDIIVRLLSFIAFVGERQKSGQNMAEEFHQFHRRRAAARKGVSKK